MNINVGDYVTWRSGGPNTLGLRGCKVMGFVEADDGTPGAWLDIGRFSDGGKFELAAVAHLEPEAEAQ